MEGIDYELIQALVTTPTYSLRFLVKYSTLALKKALGIQLFTDSDIISTDLLQTSRFVVSYDSDANNN